MSKRKPKSLFQQMNTEEKFNLLMEGHMFTLREMLSLDSRIQKLERKKKPKRKARK